MTNPRDEVVDRDVLGRFRALLADYEIVVTGVATVDRQLAKSADPLAGVLREKLLEVTERFALSDRRRLWLLQVSDRRLAELYGELLAVAREPDEIGHLDAGVRPLRHWLSAMSHTLEASFDRRHGLNETPAPPEASHKDWRAAKADNLDRMAYELAFGRTALHSRPIRHALDTTSRCNFRCLTCHQSAHQDVVHYDLADVNLGAITSVFREAKQIFVAGMGETLLSRSAFDLAALGHATGGYVEIISNGSTLHRAARMLPVVDLFMVSMDGGTAQSYNGVRRHGEFDRLMLRLADLTEDERRKVCFNFVVCKQNVYTAPEAIERAIALRIGQVYFQEMNGYLEWHDRMLIDEAERAWLFEQVEAYRRVAEAAGVALTCNLARPQPGCEPARVDMYVETARSLAAMHDVPMAQRPARVDFGEAATRLDELMQEPVSPMLEAFRRITEAMVPDEVALAAAPPPAPEDVLDWKALRAHVNSGQAQVPHCMSTYAHVVVNGDGTTRSCCKVQSRLADVDQKSFGEIWNGPAYQALRADHIRQIAPRDACHDCRDPVRFHFLADALERLDAHGVDVTRIRKPADFPIPGSSANHPLVMALGRRVDGGPDLKPADDAEDAWRHPGRWRRIARLFRRGDRAASAVSAAAQPTRGLS